MTAWSSIETRSWWSSSCWARRRWASSRPSHSPAPCPSLQTTWYRSAKPLTGTPSAAVGRLFAHVWLSRYRLANKIQMAFMAFSVKVFSVDTTTWPHILGSSDKNSILIKYKGKQMDSRVRSAKPRSALPTRQRSLREKLRLAMTLDKACGGPFQIFLRGVSIFLGSLGTREPTRLEKSRPDFFRREQFWRQRFEPK